jgi:hypothetical protein
MRELMTSLMRLTGAVTMFGMEQAQNAIGAPLNTRDALVRLCATLDSMADSLVSKMDDSKKAVYKSMAAAETDAVDRTLGAVNLDLPGEFMQRTSQSLSSFVRKSNGGVTGAA